MMGDGRWAMGKKRFVAVVLYRIEASLAGCTLYTSGRRMSVKLIFAEKSFHYTMSAIWLAPVESECGGGVWIQM